jgi:hypothetical protein
MEDKSVKLLRLLSYTIASVFIHRKGLYDQGAQVCSSSSGHGHLVFGDSEGNVHLVNRMFEVSTFRAHELKVSLIHHIQNSSLLVTIGVSCCSNPHL